MKAGKRALHTAGSVLLSALLLCGSAQAFKTSETYTYDAYGTALYLREAYETQTVLTGEMLGTAAFKNIQGLYQKNGKLYICDSGNNRILQIDGNLRLERILDGFLRDGVWEEFRSPQDIAVGSEGDMYIVDYSNNRIVVLDKDGGFVRVIERVTSDMLPANFVFTPMKIVVDSSDNLYVVSKGVNLGIMDMSREGVVRGFLGATKVNFDLGLYIKKLFMTDEQSAQLQKIVPTEYNNVYIDDSDFIYGTINIVNAVTLAGEIKSNLFVVDGVNIPQINESLVDTLLRMIQYTTAQSGQNDLVKKLNMKGEDILRRTGYYPVVGDLDFEADEEVTDLWLGPSRFGDIVVHPSGAYSILDKNRNRIFTYDEYGILLFAFGGTGKADGLFDTASAIELLGDRLAVSDSSKNTVVFFRRTEFAECIFEAIDEYAAGHYRSSQTLWERTIALSSNFQIGYVGIGRALLHTGEHEQAMRYFKLGDYREGYDKAFELYRQSILRSVLAYGIAAAIVLFAVAVAVKRRRRSRLAIDDD